MYMFIISQPTEERNITRFADSTRSCYHGSMNDNTDIMARIHHTDMNAYKGYVASAIQTIMGKDSSYNAKNTAQYVNACLSFLDSDAPGAEEICDAFIGIGCLVESKLIPMYDIKKFIHIVKIAPDHSTEYMKRSVCDFFISNRDKTNDDEHGYDVFITMLPHAIDIYQREHPYTNRHDAMELASCIRYIGNFIEYQMLKDKAGYALNDDMDYLLGHCDNSGEYLDRIHNFEIMVKHADGHTVKSLLELFLGTMDYQDSGLTTDEIINGTMDSIMEIVICGPSDADIPTQAFHDMIWLGQVSLSDYEFMMRFAIKTIKDKNKGISSVAIFKLYEFVIAVFSAKEWRSYHEILEGDCLQDFLSFTQQQTDHIVALKKCYGLYSKNEASYEFLKEALFME